MLYIHLFGMCKMTPKGFIKHYLGFVVCSVCVCVRKFGFESNFMDIAHGLQTMCINVLNQSDWSAQDLTILTCFSQFLPCPFLAMCRHPGPVRGWFAVPPGSSAAFAEVWDREPTIGHHGIPWHGTTLRHQRLHTLLDQDGGIFGLGGVADTTVRQPRG